MLRNRLTDARDNSVIAIAAIFLSLFLPISFNAPVANADTAGSGVCQQTFTTSGTGTASVAVSESDGSCYIAFKNNGAVNTQSTFSWSVPSGVTTADILVIGGGGGGGSRQWGGGGAGGYVEATGYSLSSSPVSIVVGAGGAGNSGNSSLNGTSGNDSSFTYNGNGLTAKGGGFGGSVAASGGSGGGSGGTGTAGGVTSVQQKTLAGSNLSGIAFGNAGAAGATENSIPLDFWAGGGGGGAGSAGKLPTQNGSEVSVFTSNTSAVGGIGGVGKAPTWLSTSIGSALGVGQASSSQLFFAGGGGGGIGYDGNSGGAGGVGGGGAGFKVEAVSTANNGVAHTGGGGGSSGYRDATTPVSNYPAAGSGGSGVVIVRYSIYSITVTQTPNGNISPGSTRVNSSDVVTFTFTPDEGYQVASILIDGVAISTPSATNFSTFQSAIINGYTFSNVTSNRTISATFTPIVSSNLLLNLDASKSSSLNAANGTSSPTWTSISPGATVNAVGSSSTQVSIDATTSPNTPKSVYLNNNGSSLADRSGAFFNFGADNSGVALGTESEVSNVATTLEMWVNPATLRTGNSTPWNILFTKWFSNDDRNGSSEREFHYALKFDGTNVRQNLYTTSCDDKYGSKIFSTTADINKWFLIGFTVDTSGTAQFYLNGKPDGNSITDCAIKADATPTSTTFLGDVLQAVGFNGSVGKVRFFNSALTAAQMQSNYNADAPLFAAAPVYTIFYDYGSATGGNSTVSADYTFGGTEVTLPTPTRTGFSFNGWFTQSSGGTKIGNGGASISTNETKTLYAQWLANAVSPTVSSQPSGITRTYGQSASFSVTASASDGGALSYQ